MAIAPAFFVSADWSTAARKRAVYVADLTRNQIRHAATDTEWTLPALLAYCRRLTHAGPVLVGIDAALGVSRGYWDLVGPQPRSFLDWLRDVDPDRFFGITTDPTRWCVDRPWFRVPSGKGGKRAFTGQVSDGFLRKIDQATRANPLFAVSGIPGTVGAATRDCWQTLVPLLAEADRGFAVWPFDGNLPDLLAKRGIVLAETYPRLAYAAALAAHLPASRISVSKVASDSRNLACDHLQRATWITANTVDLGDLDRVRANEDDFDAHFTAAGVLRCSVEGIDLANKQWIDPTVEGSMLLAGPVDPSSRETKLTTLVGRLSGASVDGLGPKARRPATPLLRGLARAAAVSRSSRAQPHAPGTRGGQSGAPTSMAYRCPIPGCAKVFYGSRGGWDAHIEWLRIHPNWHPGITDRTERKRLFRREYRDWLVGPSR